MNTIRVILHAAALPDYLWWYAALHAAYIHNRVPKSALNNVTPYYKRFKADANFDTMQKFGHPCIVYNEHRPNKLAPKGKRGVWVGYAESAKGHYIYFGSRVGVERNLKFVDS